MAAVDDYSDQASVSDRLEADAERELLTYREAFRRIPDETAIKRLRNGRLFEFFPDGTAAVVAADLGALAPAIARHGLVHAVAVQLRVTHLLSALFEHYNCLALSTVPSSDVGLLVAVMPSTETALAAALQIKHVIAAYNAGEARPDWRLPTGAAAVTRAGAQGATLVCDQVSGRLSGVAVERARNLALGAAQARDVVVDATVRAEAASNGNFAGLTFKDRLDASGKESGVHGVVVGEFYRGTAVPVALIQSVFTQESTNEASASLSQLLLYSASSQELTAQHGEVRARFARTVTCVRLAFTNPFLTQPGVAANRPNGVEHAGVLRQRAFQICEAVVHHHGGMLVEEEMWFFDEPLEALQAALDARRALRVHNESVRDYERIPLAGLALDMGDVLLVPHTSIHAGEPTCTTAALVTAARHGEVILSRAVVGVLCGPGTGFGSKSGKDNKGNAGPPQVVLHVVHDDETSSNAPLPHPPTRDDDASSVTSQGSGYGVADQLKKRARGDGGAYVNLVVADLEERRRMINNDETVTFYVATEPRREYAWTTKAHLASMPRLSEKSSMALVVGATATEEDPVTAKDNTTTTNAPVAAGAGKEPTAGVSKTVVNASTGEHSSVHARPRYQENDSEHDDAEEEEHSDGADDEVRPSSRGAGLQLRQTTLLYGNNNPMDDNTNNDGAVGPDEHPDEDDDEFVGLHASDLQAHDVESESDGEPGPWDMQHPSQRPKPPQAAAPPPAKPATPKEQPVEMNNPAPVITTWNDMDCVVPEDDEPIVPLPPRVPSGAPKPVSRSASSGSLKGKKSPKLSASASPLLAPKGSLPPPINPSKSPQLPRAVNFALDNEPVIQAPATPPSMRRSDSYMAATASSRAKEGPAINPQYSTSSGKRGLAGNTSSEVSFKGLGAVNGGSPLRGGSGGSPTRGNASPGTEEDRMYAKSMQEGARVKRLLAELDTKSGGRGLSRAVSEPHLEEPVSRELLVHFNDADEEAHDAEIEARVERRREIERRQEREREMDRRRDAEWETLAAGGTVPLLPPPVSPIVKEGGSPFPPASPIGSPGANTYGTSSSPLARSPLSNVGRGGKPRLRTAALVVQGLTAWQAAAAASGGGPPTPIGSRADQLRGKKRARSFSVHERAGPHLQGDAEDDYLEEVLAREASPTRRSILDDDSLVRLADDTERSASRAANLRERLQEYRASDPDLTPARHRKDHSPRQRPKSAGAARAGNGGNRNPQRPASTRPASRASGGGGGRKRSTKKASKKSRSGAASPTGRRSTSPSGRRSPPALRPEMPWDWRVRVNSPAPPGNDNDISMDPHAPRPASAPLRRPGSPPPRPKRSTTRPVSRAGHVKKPEHKRHNQMTFEFGEEEEPPPPKPRQSPFAFVGPKVERAPRPKQRSRHSSDSGESF